MAYILIKTTILHNKILSCISRYYSKANTNIIKCISYNGINIIELWSRCNSISTTSDISCKCTLASAIPFEIERVNRNCQR